MLKLQSGIRPMGLGDIDPIVRVEGEIYEFPWSAGNFKDSLRAGYSCWILLEAGALAGYAVVMIGVDEAHLLNLSVAKLRQRQGLGRKMMGHLLEVVKGHASQRFLLEVRETNLAARGFYASQGFIQLGVRRYYYPAREGREDAVMMELKL